MTPQVRNSTPLPKAIHATHNGDPVRILLGGDVEGMSPAFGYIDEHGRIAWASQSEFRVVDPDFLPVSRASVEAAIGR